MPLRATVAADNKAVVAVLLGKGVNVNAADKYGVAPLMSGQSAEIAKLLIDRGTDVNARCNDGITPLMDNAALICATG